MESIYEFVLEQLEASKGEWPRVAREVGISRRTIEKIARREVADPGVSRIEKLAKYFHDRPRAS
jgi:transcriptional regulator with XRE-family HTH domain